MTRAVQPVALRADTTSGDALLDALVAAATVETPTDADRRRAAETVFDVAGGDPETLEAARLLLQRRLAHRSDDFAAGRGLRAIRAALARTAPPEGPWRWQQR